MLLASDRIQSTRTGRRWGSFVRFPSRIPALTRRGAGASPEAVEGLEFDRLYDNFGSTIDTDASGAVRRSAERYAAWAGGEHDDLT